EVVAGKGKLECFAGRFWMRSALSRARSFARIERSMISLQVFYEGNVQGVGFRWSVRHIAKGFDVTGWVRNLRAGGRDRQVHGAGKSTTVKIILGLVSPTRGRTEIVGRDSRLVESRQAVGFLPENPYFYKFLTGEETLRFFGRLCGLAGVRLENRINELLDLVGLTKARKRRLGTYSKGMLQRIGLAQALIHDPRLVVLDEPTAGVDPAGSREIRDLILDLRRRGITVLLSSHLLAQAQEICDRVGILADGILVREGHLQELIAIENQTEFVIADASMQLVDQIESLINRSNAKLIARQKSTTTLERLFLDATTKRPES